MALSHYYDRPTNGGYFGSRPAYSNPASATSNGGGSGDSGGGMFGQGDPQVTAPGNAYNLGGTSYNGAFGNSISNIPVFGGALSGILSSLYGSKPSTPNPNTTAFQAISGNLRNLPAIGSLAAGTEAISAGTAKLPYELNLPNYDQLMAQASGNTLSELHGELPSDVKNMLAQAAAERGVSTGVGFDSPNAGSAYLRALGLTSLDQMQHGQQNLSQLISETPRGQNFNLEDMMVMPSDQQAAQTYANQIAAAPDPQAVGLMNTLTSFI